MTTYMLAVYNTANTLRTKLYKKTYNEAYEALPSRLAIGYRAVICAVTYNKVLPTIPLITILEVYKRTSVISGVIRVR